MKFSPNGEHVLGGIGGAVHVIVDGVTPPELSDIFAADWGWLSDTVIAGPGGFNSPDAGIYTFDLVTRARLKVSPRVSTAFFAAAGKWVAYRADGATWSFDSEGRQWLNYVAVGIRANGEYLFTDTSNQRFYVDRGRGIEPLATRPIELTTRFCDTPEGRRWICDGQNGLIVHEGGQTLVYKLNDTPHDYNPAIAYRLSDGVIVVATGDNAGETAQHLYELVFDMGWWRKDGGPWQPLTLVDVSVLTVQRFTHPVLVAAFKDPDGQSGAPAEIAVNHLRPFPGRPFFVGDEDCLPLSPTKDFWGWYVEGDPAAGLKLARKYRTRAIVVHDAATDWLVPVTDLEPWDIATLEFYRVQGESRAQAKARWARQADQLLADWPHQCGAVLMCYGGAWPVELWTEDDMIAAVVDGVEIINARPRFVLAALFAYLRLNGLSGHPRVLAAVQPLFTGQRPTLMAIGELPKPTPVTPPVTPKPTPAPVIVPAPISQEHEMFYLIDKPIPATAFTVVSQGDTVALKNAEGKFLEMDAFGNTKLVDEPNQGDAAFKRGHNGGLVAHDRGGDKKCFAVEGIEA